MAISIRSSDRPARRAAITRAERRLGFGIPDAYREFLRSRNGGRPEANLLMTDPAVGVTALLGVERDEESDLVATYQAFQGRVPSHLLPFAHAEGGNLICLSLRPEDRGSVWFWDHELESDEGQPVVSDNIRRVAPSFDEFIAGLVPASSAGLPEVTVEDAWIDPAFLNTQESSDE